MRLDVKSTIRLSPPFPGISAVYESKWERDPETGKPVVGPDGKLVKRDEAEWLTHTFYVSGKPTTLHMTDGQYAALIEKQKQVPVPLGHYNPNGHWYWIFRDRIYRTTENYSDSEALALLVESELRKKRKLGRAMALLSQEVDGIADRSRHIAEEVRLYVWRRDSGQCVKCGSREQIEYDHIIPISKGGGSTARNVQILCGECNREKSDGLY